MYLLHLDLGVQHLIAERTGGAVLAADCVLPFRTLPGVVAHRRKNERAGRGLRAGPAAGASGPGEEKGSADWESGAVIRGYFPWRVLPPCGRPAGSPGRVSGPGRARLDPVFPARIWNAVVGAGFTDGFLGAFPRSFPSLPGFAGWWRVLVPEFVWVGFLMQGHDSLVRVLLRLSVFAPSLVTARQFEPGGTPTPALGSASGQRLCRSGPVVLRPGRGPECFWGWWLGVPNGTQTQG